MEGVLLWITVSMIAQDRRRPSVGRVSSSRLQTLAQLVLAIAVRGMDRSRTYGANGGFRRAGHGGGGRRRWPRRSSFRDGFAPLVDGSHGHERACHRHAGCSRSWRHGHPGFRGRRHRGLPSAPRASGSSRRRAWRARPCGLRWAPRSRERPPRRLLAGRVKYFTDLRVFGGRLSGHLEPVIGLRLAGLAVRRRQHRFGIRRPPPGAVPGAVHHRRRPQPTRGRSERGGAAGRRGGGPPARGAGGQRHERPRSDLAGVRPVC